MSFSKSSEIVTMLNAKVVLDANLKDCTGLSVVSVGMPGKQQQEEVTERRLAGKDVQTRSMLCQYLCQEEYGN